MSDYKINIQMSISNIDEIEQSISVISESSPIAEGVAESIDGIERALLSVSKETIRATLAKHLEELSKKKPL